MKKKIALILVFALIVGILSGCGATNNNNNSEVVPQPEVKSEFIFDLEKNYVGQYTTEYEDGNYYTFKTYQAAYCDTPYTDEWKNAADYFKLNIKVPVSFNDKQFDQAGMADAPIMFYNPWSGDRGSSPVGKEDAVDNEVVADALARGWVVVTPGMRGGNNCFSGTIGQDDYVNYGKLPGPLADLKAAIRYLRYETNAETIPGDKEHIWISGKSSGGSSTIMIGVSGNSPFFDEALEEIGALPGRDDVFGALTSAPVLTRSWADPAMAWEHWGDLRNVEGADELNVFLTTAYIDYLNGLGLKATFDVEGKIKKGDALTSENYADYLMMYVKQSAIKYLNNLGGRESINNYLAEGRTNDRWIQPSPETSRDWIKPVFDENDPNRVVDIEGTWDEFWDYFVGEDADDYTKRTGLLLFDGPAGYLPDELLEENGVGNSEGAKDYASLSSPSFGKTSDYIAVYSEWGREWIQKERGITISDEYQKLLQMQSDSINAMYFVNGEGASGATVCPNWFLRGGGLDFVVPWPTFVNLAVGLENMGKNVNAGFDWEEGHVITSDRPAFFDFAEEAMK